MCRLPHLVVFVALTACSGPDATPDSKLTESSAETVAPDDTTESPPEDTVEPAPDASAEPAYEVGDYIVYRYTGSFTDEPVTLRKEVIARDGIELEIKVTATRGDASRSWIQVVRDTPDNRAHHPVETLYEIVDGERVERENAWNDDLFRLYEWTLPPCEGEETDRKETEKTIEIAGESYSCTCRSAVQPCPDEPARLEACQCEEFLWTNAPSSAVEVDSGDDVWRLEVVETGSE